MPGRLSPALAALAVQFGLECSFGRAAQLLTAACGTHVSHDTVRRVTEGAGASWWQVELDLVTTLETQALTPHAPAVAVPDRHLPSPDRALQVSIDGAMVPLVGGEWAEVRTLVIGEVGVTGSGPKAMSLSYVSQLETAATFSRTVLAEVTRRGVSAHPSPIVAVSDGAVWIQELLDLHCPQAIRVLDIVHAVGYLAQAAQAAFGSGTDATSEWIAVWRHALRQGQTIPVLAALAALPPSPARTDALRYLSARIAMLDYPRCDAEGWPVGSGAVESANKVVVETRLKGPGMHWTRNHANAMVGLRAMVASGRWATTWPRIVAAMRATQSRRAMVRRAARVRPPVSVACAPPPAPPPDPSPPVSRPKQVINGKPTPDHPWRRSLHGRTPHPPGSS